MSPRHSEVGAARDYGMMSTILPDPLAYDFPVTQSLPGQSLHAGREVRSRLAVGVGHLPVAHVESD